MKLYFYLIAKLQIILLFIGVAILIIVPEILVFKPDFIPETTLYAFAHHSLFLVMIVRPLADLLPKSWSIRPLVILRKGVGVFSASIIVSFIIAKLISTPEAYISSIGTTAYWSLDGLALFAHLADISAVLLLITSNNLSKKLLGMAWWKRIQKLSYVYFYGSSLYLLLVLHNTTIAVYIFVVTTLTFGAYIKNRQRRLQAEQTSYATN